MSSVAVTCVRRIWDDIQPPAPPAPLKTTNCLPIARTGSCLPDAAPEPDLPLTRRRGASVTSFFAALTAAAP
jgi:hypothetical protein